ncbi:DUF1992 domain-containing protein [Microbacterium sp. W1N]|uniref:DnaJ family domain-containing protein n=1 Tax=Microbacterium festucae TaxID=2977531 RepID=UPI0021BFDF22|nr:DUF1992 domain-containing protein [Microbacterium festucae]MCT9821327.1 DUF1992 domain-containing protein [Microbacterium festucae]
MADRRDATDPRAATRDARIEALRYRAAQAAGPEHEVGESSHPDAPPATPSAHDRAMYVETAIQQAIRRGDFDDLPGAGKPLEGLGDHHDPDWWIRRKIQTEQLTGLGPPALTLRTEHAEFAERVDALRREDDVRDYVDDFNRRVIEARRQLQGGPPVVTPTHDVEAEVAAWRARRAAAPAPEPGPEPGPRRWWRRRG